MLHAGPIVAGECGDAKLSIVYLGDTLNTAARLEQTAKALDRACLVSGELLRRLEIPAVLAAEPLGPIALRGRQQPVDTYALEPAGALVATAHATAAPDRRAAPPSGVSADRIYAGRPALSRPSRWCSRSAARL